MIRNSNRLGHRVTVGEDLVAVGVVSLLVAAVVFVEPLRIPGLTLIAASLLVLFLPGYCITAVFLPSRTGIQRYVMGDSAEAETVFRVALAVGSSVAVSGGVGMLMYFAAVPITRGNVSLALLGLTATGIVLAWVRRQSLPASVRYDPAILSTVRRTSGTTASGELLSRFVPILVVVALVASVSLVAVAVQSPDSAEQFTELGVLVPNEDGAATANDYPSEMTVGESQRLQLVVENEEHEAVEYTMVVLAQRTTVEDGERTVAEEAELDQFSFTLASGETWERSYEYEASLRGETVRTTFLLYRGEPPANPSLDSAYREVHFWTTVREGETES